MEHSPSPTGPATLVAGFSGISSDDALRVVGYIEAALAHSGGTHHASDVVDAIISGRMQLWLAPSSAVVTSIIRYPRMMACQLFLVGGSLRELLAIEPQIATWAREMGCGRLECGGRAGWLRVLPRLGWEPSNGMTKGLADGL